MRASDSNAPPLAMRLLGPLQVSVQGQPLPHLRSRKSLWLLALLTLRHERPLDRDWLAGLLWPESQQEQALANLRQNLRDLRSALGAQAYRLQAPASRSLCLDMAGSWVDVIEFDAALVRGDGASMEQAISLYAGPLLEGCDEEWAFAERRHREQSYLQALETLAEQSLHAGDAARSVGYLRQVMEAEPLRESAQRSLMQAAAAAGDYAGATQAYRTFRLLLHREMHAEPSAETTALYRQIRSDARRPVTASGRLSANTEPPASGMPSLPRPLTPLIGRQQEIQQIQALLASERLVTLTGTGGVGKTRLALQVAEEAEADYAQGVWFVELAALNDPSLVTQAVATTLGVREQPGCHLVETLIEYIQAKTLLVALDNCEHLLEGCAPLVQRLLQASAGLRVLATSRQTLGLVGERTYRVPSLSVPDMQALEGAGKERAALLLEYEAAQMFVMRATQAEPAFMVTGENAVQIGQVCARLEGIPLALELAAARVKVLTLPQLVSRLEDRFRLLTGGSRTALPRHQTLRATLDWSYGLISEPEQRLLQRLSVFAGGWTLEAAETICNVDFPIIDMKEPEITESVPVRLARAERGLVALQNPKPVIQGVEILDILASLLDKSLVEYVSRGKARYRLLETVRQYAQERLEESGEAAELRRRHRDYFLTLAEAIFAISIWGHKEVMGTEQLEAEHDNLRAALAECQAAEDGIEAGLRLTGAMWIFWWSHGYVGEGRAHLMEALGRKGTGDRTRARLEPLRGVGILASIQNDYEVAKAFLKEGLALSRERDDRGFIQKFINSLTDVEFYQANFETARKFYEESLALAREVGNPESINEALGGLSDVAYAQGDYETARTLNEQCLAIVLELGQMRIAAHVINSLGRIAADIGDFTAARAYYEQSLTICRELGAKHPFAEALMGQGDVSYEQGDCEAAAALYKQSLAMMQELGQRSGIADALRRLGNVAHRQGDYETVRAQYAQSLALQRDAGARWGITYSLRNFARLALAQGQPERAARLWGAAEALRQAIGSAIPPIAQDECAQLVAAMRATLGEEVFTEVLVEGRAMTLEQAVAYALAPKSTMT